MFEPAWLIAAVDQRMALIESVLGKLKPANKTVIIETTLEEPSPDATELELERWERSCSNCNKFCHDEFHLGNTLRSMRNGAVVVFNFGVCSECRAGFGQGD